MGTTIVDFMSLWSECKIERDWPVGVEHSIFIATVVTIHTPFSANKFCEEKTNHSQTYP